MNPPIKPTHTPPRQIRIGDNWEKLDRAAKTLGRTRADIVNELIAWYLREPGVRQPARPERSAWAEATD